MTSPPFFFHISILALYNRKIHVFYDFMTHSRQLKKRKPPRLTSVP